ncbi:MAG: ester cyclase [Solirubrobacteraceae bacterium]
MSAREETIALLERLGVAILSNDPARVAALYTDDCVIADSAMQIRGKSGLLDALRYFHGAFEVLELTLADQVIDGSNVAVRVRWRALHRGEYLGVPGTGRIFDSWNVGLLTIRDGLIAKDNSIWDASELLRLRALAAEAD